MEDKLIFAIKIFSVLIQFPFIFCIYMIFKEKAPLFIADSIATLRNKYNISISKNVESIISYLTKYLGGIASMFVIMAQLATTENNLFFSGYSGVLILIFLVLFTVLEMDY